MALSRAGVKPEQGDTPLPPRVAVSLKRSAPIPRPKLDWNGFSPHTHVFFHIAPVVGKHSARQFPRGKNHRKNPIRNEAEEFGATA